MPNTTTPTRVTRFASQSNGARSFGITVNGLRVLVTADEGQHDAGAALASAIAALGPKTIAPETGAPAPTMPTEPAIVAPKRREFRVGQRIWCNVHASRGFVTVTEVGSDRRRGYIKISGYRAWCPTHNFDEQAPV